MNTTEFLNGINKLELAYNQKFSKDKLNLWYQKLKDMDYQEYITRIDELIEVNSFLPNIAEILNKPKHSYTNYDQRDYKDIDFNSLYAN